MLSTHAQFIHSSTAPRHLATPPQVEAEWTDALEQSSYWRLRVAQTREAAETVGAWERAVAELQEVCSHASRSALTSTALCTLHSALTLCTRRVLCVLQVRSNSSHEARLGALVIAKGLKPAEILAK